MVVCNCRNNIESFVTIAQRPWTSTNRSSRHVIITGGAHLVCRICATRIIDRWERHNIGRIEPYAIGRARINVAAETKRAFLEMALPRIRAQFNWYVPESEVRHALTNTIKN